MSVFESVVENREHELETLSECKTKLEGFDTMQDGASDRLSAYQDRIARLEQRSAARQEASEERAGGQNEISFGSRAVENVTEKLKNEEKERLDRESKQVSESTRINEIGLRKAIKDGSQYWTQHYKNELENDARKMKEIQKKMSELSKL